jgi:hypothetical protein
VRFSYRSNAYEREAEERETARWILTAAGYLVTDSLDGSLDVYRPVTNAEHEAEFWRRPYGAVVVSRGDVLRPALRDPATAAELARRERNELARKACVDADHAADEARRDGALAKLRELGLEGRAAWSAHWTSDISLPVDAVEALLAAIDKAAS